MISYSKMALLSSALIALSMIAPGPSLAQVAHPTMTAQPFLCAEQGDGSAAKYVNNMNRLDLCINIAERADMGGVQIEGVAGMPATSVNVTSQGDNSDVVIVATYHYANGARTVALKPTSIGIASGPAGTFWLLGYGLNAPIGSKFDSLYIVDNYHSVALAKGKLLVENIQVDQVPVNGKSLSPAECVALPPLGGIGF